MSEGNVGDDPARNNVSGGVFHGPVVQARDIAGSVIVTGKPGASNLWTRPEKWPLARDWNPISAGTHWARSLPDGDNVPPYIERDIDVTLREAVAAAGETGDLVLLVGNSAAGKTRAAFEAIQAVLPELRVATPVTAAEVLATTETIERAGVRCLLWLDNVDLHLKSGAVDQATLEDCRRLRVPVIATIRVNRYKSFSDAAGSSLADGVDPALAQTARIGARVLETTEPIVLSRIWSAAELERASASTDERVRDAVAHHGPHGVAEYLAAGPAIWSEWRRSVDVEGKPRGAALIGAAIDLARAGLPGPYPQELLAELHEHHLEAMGGVLLRPEPLDEAFAWASEIRLGVTSPLLPAAGGMWRVFDYLVDRMESLEPCPPVPDVVWPHAARAADPADLMGVATAAAEAATRVSFRIAEEIWRPIAAADAGPISALALFNLGVLCSEADRPEESIELFKHAADRGEPRSAFNLGVLADRAGDKAAGRSWTIRAAELGYGPALFRLGFAAEEQGLLSEAEDWYRQGAALGDHQSATNLGKILSLACREEEAQQWFLRAAEEGDEIATFNIGLFHHEAGRLDEAERWYLLGIERGSAEAANNLSNIYKNAGDQAGAERWLRHAADAGYPGAAFNLGLLYEESGQPREAESWFRRAADNGHLQAIHALGRIRLNEGRLDETISWLQRAVDLGDREADGIIGDLLLDLGRTEEAVPHLTVAAEAGHQDSAFNLGTIYANNGEVNESAHWYRQAAEGGDAEAAANLADVLFRAGRVASAVWWSGRAGDLRAAAAES
ncbi:sel1 repeat family protein [Amycolatopsis sp. AA4]|nr:sel1 repeat family protein [Amycolatopsis sp. AA4]EFL07610.1 predicted protein [Streptomyces sp. AA4]